MSAVILRAVKHNGRLDLTAPALYRQYVGTVGDGEEREVRIRPVPKRQGSQSMRYYRGVVVPDIAYASGVSDPDDYESVHESLAWKFLRLPDHPFGYPQRRSTAKDQMSQEDITTYIDQVILYAETTIPGCRIRRPHEVDLDQTVDYEWDAV